MGRFTAPGRSGTSIAEETGTAEDFDFFLLVGRGTLAAETLGGMDVCPLISSASITFPTILTCFCFFFWPFAAAFFLSSFATASASQAAFSLPRPPPGRLRHSADPASLAFSARLLLL